MNKTPLTVAKQRFETKEKLVAAIQKLATPELWVDRLNDDKGLSRVSNAKLLRLHDALESAKAQFGSRAKLIDAILDLQKRGKDAGLKSRLEGYPVPRLLDLHKTATRRARGSDAAAAGGEAKPKVRAAKKAPAKPAAAKGAPAKKGCRQGARQEGGCQEDGEEVGQEGHQEEVTTRLSR